MLEKQPLFRIVVQEIDELPGLTGLCAGYELGEWRASALATHLMDSLPEFCLTYSEYQTLSIGTIVPLIREAAKRVYQTDKFHRRGEFGELLLHVVLRQVFGTVPAISKIYYKDAANDTVKGFDAVHVVASDVGLELWLGEVKFYHDVHAAVRDVVAELRKHTSVDYLRAEFIAIKSKVDDEWPHADRLRRLLDENVSLDQVFDSTCIPVLLTYDGPATARHIKHCEQYFAELCEELREIHEQLRASGLPEHLRVHLILLPLATKNRLLSALDEKLKAWQTI